ncbi:MAG: hypothetical protein B6U88_01460 [Candidatus Aenigmarchaeota archaeon ex4484_56]|nr:MAG: hypothetical protein B6U88_01460 [Candidatus Aenigmarchaeota archaeon ex4484_56]
MLSKKEIAERRINILFRLAEEMLRKGRYDKVKRYIELSRKISMRINYTIPKELKRRFCKKCNMLLIPGISCTVRLNPKTKTVNIKCFNCNNIKRYPYEQNRKRLA